MNAKRTLDGTLGSLITSTDTKVSKTWYADVTDKTDKGAQMVLHRFGTNSLAVGLAKGYSESRYIKDYY